MRIILLSLCAALLSMQAAVAQNHPPVAVADTVNAVSQVPMIIDVLANDYDPDGDQLYITEIWSSSGEATIQDGKIYYIPDNITGEHGLRYTITDGAFADNEWVRVMVNVNPNAPVAVADTFELLELSVQDFYLMTNDYDPNGDAFNIVYVKSSGCNVIINPDSLSVKVSVYAGDYASFTYTIREKSSTQLMSDEVKVTLYLNPNPDRPVAVPDTVYAIGGISADFQVLANDYDPQGDDIEVSTINHVSNGIIEKINGGIRYTSELSFSGKIITYYSIKEVNDTLIYSHVARLVIFVEKNPHCPVGLPDVASGMSGVPVIIDVLANDYDPDGDLIEIYGGTITPDNKLIYTPPSYVTGADSIYYKVREISHPDSYSGPVKIKISVQPNPAFPWGVNDTVNILAGSTVVIHPLENDVLNGFDSLKIRNVFHYSQDQTLLLQYTDQTVTVSIPYQAKGLYKLRYMMGPVDSTMAYAGRGDIVINIEKRNYHDSLKVNNINAGVDADGNLFSMISRYPEGACLNGQCGGEFYQHFIVPADQSASTIFQNRFIIGGFDQNNKLHITNNTEDWKAGPVSESYIGEYDLRFLRLWKITREEIEFHKQNRFTPGYVPEAAIMDWPGNGNTQAGQALHLAPFFDENGDDNYIPEQGDYPLIRGDECIFFMANDNTLRIDTLGQPLNVELHGMVYAFNSPDDTALWNTIFVHYDIINRSENTYNDCYAGVFNDYDIGSAFDDFYRTDVGRASIIGYNGNNIDESTDSEQQNYGDNPPAQSITVLGGPFMDTDGNDNPAGGCDVSVNGLNFGNGVADDERVGLSGGLYFQPMENSWPFYDPVDYSEMYNYMNGIWDDETPVLYGGNGHISNGGNGTHAMYMFPGDSDPWNYGTNCQLPGNGFNQGTKFWTEEQTRNRPSDRRGLASMGPFTLVPGQVQEIDLAYCTGLGTNGAMSSVNQLLRNIDSLRNAIAEGRILVPNSSLGIYQKEAPATVTLYPNPASEVLAVSNFTSTGTAEYVIYNMYGAKLMSGRLSAGNKTITVAGFTPGMYILKITDGKNVSTGKFVKK